MFVSVYMYVFCVYYSYELYIFHIIRKCMYYTYRISTPLHIYNIFICIHVCIYVQNTDKYVLVRKYSVLYNVHICAYYSIRYIQHYRYSTYLNRSMYIHEQNTYMYLLIWTLELHICTYMYVLYVVVCMPMCMYYCHIVCIMT